jgi:outer membrane protein TolC
VKRRAQSTANFRKLNRTRLALQDAADSSQKTVAAARARYQGGVSEFTEVLQSGQNSCDIERNLVVSEAAVGRCTIALYKALALNIEPQNN